MDNDKKRFEHEIRMDYLRVIRDSKSDINEPSMSDLLRKSLSLSKEETEEVNRIFSASDSCGMTTQQTAEGFYHIDASNYIHTFIAKNSKYSEMKSFQDKYSFIMQEYMNNPRTKYSSIINFEELPAFKQWATDAMLNKNKVIPLLISKMLKGDIYSLNIYENLYENLEDDLVVNYAKIHTDKDIETRFNKYGGAEDARALINAEHWLKSKESANIYETFDNGVNHLCDINDLHSINNEYVGCSSQINRTVDL